MESLLSMRPAGGESEHRASDMVPDNERFSVEKQESNNKLETSHEEIDEENNTIGDTVRRSPKISQRPSSTLTLSRTGYTDEVQRLLSIQLPSLSQIPSSDAPVNTAVRVLQQLDDRVHAWVSDANRILSIFRAEGDVEWAAVGARTGFNDLERDVKYLGTFVEASCGRIKQLENVNTGDNAIRLLDERHQSICTEWRLLRRGFNLVNQEVELAQEWEEIRTTVLSQITKELDELSGLVFELEESRHQSVLVNLPADHSPQAQSSHVEQPKQTTSKVSRLRRFILPPSPIKESSPSPPAEMTHIPSDANLVKLVARMQPLQASLEFLPMRLSSFQARASEVFPAACRELKESQVALEHRWKHLRNDAEALRRELGEDRFILVFRNAGKQAMGMMQAVETSLVKVREVFDNAAKSSHGPGTMKKIESYEAKKLHYCPAIERVLALVDRGAKDRLTVNGEIVRLQAELNQRWQNLQSQMRSVDFTWDCYDEAQQRYRESQVLMHSVEDSLPHLSSSPTPTASPSSSPRSSNFSQSMHPSQSQKNNRPFPLLLAGYGAKQPPKPVRTGSKLETGTYMSTFSQRPRDASHERQRQRHAWSAPESAPKPRWNYSNVVPEPKPTYVVSPLPRQDTHPPMRAASRQQSGAFTRAESPMSQSPSRSRTLNRNSMFFASSQSAPQPATPLSRPSIQNRNSTFFSTTPSSITTSTPAYNTARNRNSMYFAPSTSTYTPPPSHQATRNKNPTTCGPASLATPPPSTQPRSNNNKNKPLSSPLSNSPFPSPPLIHEELMNGLLTPPPSSLKPRESLPGRRSRGSSSHLGASSSSGGSFLPRPTFWRLGTSPEDRRADNTQSRRVGAV